MKNFQRLRRIGVAAAHDFKIRTGKSLAALHGEPGHLQTYMAVCYTVVLFVRRLSRRHVPDLVQAVFVIGLFSEEKVTVMDRVECTAHDSDFPHIQ